MRDEVVYWVLVNCQQICERIFGACLQLRNEGRLLIGRGKRPLKRHPNRSRGIHHAPTIPVPGFNCKTAHALLPIGIDTRRELFVPIIPTWYDFGPLPAVAGQPGRGQAAPTHKIRILAKVIPSLTGASRHDKKLSVRLKGLWRSWERA